MSTGRDIITASMRKIGVIASGETPSASELADGMSALTAMLDSWSNEGLTVNASVREEFSLTVNDGSYTIGTSGNFNTTRPMSIDQATIEDQSSSPAIEYPLKVLSQKEWADIAQKDLTAARPTAIYIEPTYPLTTINLWPVPTVANKLVLYSKKPLATLANASSSFSLPPGYERTIIYGHAIEIAPEYGKQVSPEILNTFLDAMEKIKRTNIKTSYLEVDAGLRSCGTYDIYKGE